jgi:D-alanyl-lipoteichoic acid acyltransferase DltB (MBOAT superfamily)
VFNTFVIFVVSGFWHGANWTFIVWGALNAVYFLPLLLMGKNRKNTDTVAENRMFPNFREIWQMGTTFTLTCLAWVFFRSPSVGEAWLYVQHIFTSSSQVSNFPIAYLFVLVAILIGFDWYNRKEVYYKKATVVSDFVVIVLIVVAGNFNESSFIYFQF